MDIHLFEMGAIMDRITPSNLGSGALANDAALMKYRKAWNAAALDAYNNGTEPPDFVQFALQMKQQEELQKTKGNILARMLGI